MREFPKTPMHRFYEKYGNLVIESKHDGCITIQKADLPKAIAAALATAMAEKVDEAEVTRCCAAVGIDVLSAARQWKLLAKHLFRSRGAWRDAALLSGESLDTMGYFDDPEIDALYAWAREVDKERL